MPVFSNNYISVHYIFLYNGYYLLLDDWSENQQQKIAHKPLIMGDFGIHVMDIGGIKWETNLGAPILIANSPVYSPLDILFNAIHRAMYIKMLCKKT